MKILVINCGSSSLKYQLIDMAGESVLCKGPVSYTHLDVYKRQDRSSVFPSSSRLLRADDPAIDAVF